MNSKLIRTALVSLPACFFVGCTPHVQVSAPSEPITINLNVKIDHEVRVKVEKDLDQVISKDSGLF
ncbi:MAG: YnbE family lipoprotein [Deltaproteobacteria bacterium]|nr:YnbE family lipoprotein [Deltaproteobacteria bacterium]